jgi:hypothetical protein
MQPDNPYMTDCGEADAIGAETFEVEGDYCIAITDGNGVIWNGARIAALDQKMMWIMPPAMRMAKILWVICSDASEHEVVGTLEDEPVGAPEEIQVLAD